MGKKCHEASEYGECYYLQNLKVREATYCSSYGECEDKFGNEFMRTKNTKIVKKELDLMNLKKKKHHYCSPYGECTDDLLMDLKKKKHHYCSEYGECTDDLLQDLKKKKHHYCSPYGECYDIKTGEEFKRTKNTRVVDEDW